MSEQPVKSSLISTLSANQIDALIHEEELRRKGYQFYYCIDGGDVHNYSYPLGLIGDRPQVWNIDYEYITDEQIALYYLFKDPGFKGVLLEEHFDEFRQLVNKVRLSHHQRFNTVERLISVLKQRTDKNIKDLKDELKGDIDGLNNANSPIRKNISVILSIAVGLHADGVEKLFLLKRERKVALKEEEFSDWISPRKENIFESLTANRRIVDDIYDFFKETVDESSDQMSIPTMRRHISYHRDSTVIARVMALNDYLASQNKKIIVLYLASDRKTQNIFYNKGAGAGHVFDLLNTGAIEVNGKKVNYHRNTAQVFLQLLCQEKDSKEIVDHLKNFSRIGLIKEQRQDVIDGTSDITEHAVKEVDNFLIERLDQCRKGITENSTFARIGQFKDLIESLSDKSLHLSGEVGDIVDILLRVLEQRKSIVPGIKQSIDTQLNELGQLTVFRTSIIGLDRIIENQFRRGDTIQEVDAGKDHIYGSYHYMPTFFLGEDRNSPSFYEIVGHFNDTAENLRASIFELATKLFAQKGDELILKRCVLILMLSNSKIRGQQISEHLEYELNKFNLDGSRYRSDFYYLLTWVMRRNRHYRQSIEIAEKARKKNKQDPRFYHSIALSQYCLFQEKALNDKKEDADILLGSLENTDEAIERYEEVKQGLDIGDPGFKYINQNICALLNTRIYILALGYKVDKRLFSADRLKEARSSLIKLKKEDPNYHRIPEFLQTESFLEQREFDESGNVNKLENALIVLQKALQQPKITEKLKNLCLQNQEDIKKRLADFKS